MWQALIAFLMAAVIPLAVRLLQGLGFGFVAFTGLNVVLDWLESAIFTTFESLPAKVFQVAVMVGLDQYFVIVISALAAAFALRTFGSGTVKRLMPGVTQ